MMKLRIAIAAAAFLFLAAAANAQVLVIAHPDLGAATVSKADLAKIYTGVSTRLAGGAHVVPVLLKEGPVHSQFLSAYVEKSPVALVVIWRGLVLSGQSAMPKSFDNEEDLVRYVARTPGAIGYIGTKTAHGDVKVLR
jgi:hypothetical protein